MNTIQKNPYIGPRTFQKDEGHLFFGREREARDLIALTASERLVLFYAQSGAGKSSIVNTRLIPNFERKDYEVLPVGRVSGDMPEGNEVKNIFVYNLIRGLVHHKADPEILSKLTLAQFLAGLNIDDDGYFYDTRPLEELPELGEGTTIMRRALIIDQFEELLSTHPEAWDKREDFFIQLANAMREDPYLWVVLVMREDYVAALDPYAHHLPGGLRVRYYMQRLGREAALSAVKSPVEDLRPYAEGVAQKLVDDLCGIKVQKPDGTPDIQPGQYVEPVQLQVVCYGLWENLSPEGKQITEKDLQDVGDVNQSLGKHYEGRVNAVAKAKNVKERLIREWFEKKLITTGGIRNMVLQELNKKSGGLDDEVIQALQSDLVRAEKRGGATWYELTHDRLVEPIVESNQKWFIEHLSPLQRQAAFWKDQNENESWLVRDQALVKVEEWAKDHQDELADAEKEFLNACRKLQAQIDERLAAEHYQLEMANKLAEEQARSAKISRLFSFISLGLFFIAIVAGIYAFLQAAKAKAAQDIAQSSELSTIALDRFDSQLDLALLLGVKADSINSNSQTQKTLLTLLQKSGRYRGTVKRDEDIQDIQFSPDGRTFVLRDKTGIIFWDADTLKPLNDTPLNGHFNGVTALAISKDGKFMASGATDGTIVIWDASNRQPLSKPFKAHKGRISSLAFNMDGKTLASASSDELDIILWDITNPVVPHVVGDPLSKHTSSVISIAFSPDGKTLASGSSDSSLTLWNVETHEPIGEPLTGHTGGVWSVAFTPDGKTLASGSYDDTVILWDVEKQIQIDQPLVGHTIDIEVIAISPDGKTLASGDDSGKIILWDVKTGKSIGELTGHKNWVISLAFSPDSKTLASGSPDQSVILWDVEKQTQIGQPLLDHHNSVSGLIFSPDGILISASADSTIIFWDISKVESLQKIGSPIQGHPGQPTGMLFSPDGSLLESYGEDGTFLLDVKTQKQIGVEIGSILTSPDGSILAYQTLDKTTDEKAIHMINAKTSETIGAPISGENPVFSPDSKKLAFQTYDTDGQPQLHLWSITANNEAAFLKSGSYLAFSPNSQTLVYQTTDQSTDQTFINLWDITTSKNIGENIEGSYPNFSADSQTLVYQTTDNNQTFLNLWDIKKSKNIGKDINGSYLTISLDGRFLLYQTTNINTGETAIVFWDIAKAIEFKTIASSIYLVSQNGGVLAFVTYDAEAKKSFINLLDTATGDSLVPPVEGESVNALSANGNIIFYSSSDDRGISSIKVLNTNTGDILSSIENVYINRTFELGQILVCEFNNSNNGETTILLINTISGQKIIEAIKGSYVDLVRDGEVLIYQTSDGKQNLLYTNGQYGNTVLEGVYFTTTPDGKILVYQTFENNNNIIKLWDLTTNKNIGDPLKGTYLTTSPDRETLVTRSDTNAIVFWDLTKTWPFGNPVTEKNDAVSSAALSLDSKILAFSDESGFTFQDTISGEIINTLPNEHFGRVNGVVVSPDKRTLLSIGDDGKTIPWDLNTFQALSKPITGTNAFFSPNGKFIVAIDGNKSAIAIWDLTTRQAIGEPFVGQNVTFSPSEKYAVVGDQNKNTVIVWDLIRQKAISEPLIGQNVTFSPDEKFITVGDGIKNTITLWDVTIQQAIGKPLTGQFAFFSPDNKTLALVDGNKNITTLLDIATYEPMSDPIPGTNVTISPDSKMLAVYDGYNLITTLFDLTARQIIVEPIQGSILTTTEIKDTFVIVDTARNTTAFWEWASKKPIIVMDGSDSYFTGTKINTLVVRDNVNGKTTLWNPVTREQIGATLTGAYNPIFCTDNKTVAWFDVPSTTAVFWDLEKNQSLGELKLGEQSENNGIAITFNPVCDTVAIGDYSQNETILWDLVKQKPIGETPIDGTSNALFSSDGAIVAIADNNKGVTTFWNIANAAQVGKDVQGGYAFFNPENSSIVEVEKYNSNIGSYTYTIWNLDSIKQIGDELNSYNSLAYTSDGKLIVYDKNGVNFWDVDTGKMVGQPLRGHSFPVTGMLFSPDGRILASLASDGIALTNLESQSNTHLDSGDYVGQFSGVMAFNSDGTELTALASDGTIFIWDIAGASPVLHDPLDAPYKEFINSVYRPTLSPDAKYLIYEYNSTLNIWDIDKEKPVGEPTEIKNSSGGAITFSPDGKSMFFNNGGTIFQWDEWTNPDKDPADGISFEKNSFTSLSMVMDSNDPPAPKYVLSTSSDQFTQIWDWVKKTKIGDPISGNLQVIGSNVQTQVLIYRTAGGALIKWDLNPISWKGLLCQKASRNLTWQEWEEYFKDIPYQKICTDFPIHPSVAINLREEGDQLARNGDIEAAIVKYQEAQKIYSSIDLRIEDVSFDFTSVDVLGDPDTRANGIAVQALINVGDSLAQIGNVEGAVAKYREALTIAPTISDDLRDPESRAKGIATQALINSGDSLAQAGDVESAIAKYREALTIDPAISDDLGDPDTKAKGIATRILIDTGDSLAQAGDVERAVAKYREALKIDPTINNLGDPEARAKGFAAITLINAGDKFAQAGDIEAAVANYREALTINPSISDDLGDPEARANRFVVQTLINTGDSLVQGSDIEGAISKYLDALVIDPTIGDGSGDPETKAKKMVSKALIDIRDSLAQTIDDDQLNNLCWRGSLSGFAQDVKDICERAVELDPENGNHIDSRGLNRALVGDYSGAIADFEIAITWFKENEYAEHFITEREAWIEALKNNQNPFTDPATLEILRNE